MVMDSITSLPLSLMLICGGIAYLLGSLSTAIISCKLMGLPDPRSQGSHNPGATNVMRIGGKKAAIITLLGDAFKGFLPVLFVRWLDYPEPVIAFTALAAFLGHLYPIFFRFCGGKGVATALGCILALHIWVALCALCVWLFIFKITKISSLSALTAAIFCPLFLWLFNASAYVISAVCIIAIMLIIRHRSNITRLLKGQESRFKKSS